MSLPKCSILARDGEPPNLARDLRALGDFFWTCVIPALDLDLDLCDPALDLDLGDPAIYN